MIASIFFMALPLRLSLSRSYGCPDGPRGFVVSVNVSSSRSACARTTVPVNGITDVGRNRQSRQTLTGSLRSLSYKSRLEAARKSNQKIQFRLKVSPILWSKDRIDD